MANTTNLNLVKPDYTDDADIEDINDNSDKIDAFAGNTIANIGGTDFSTSSTYAVGAIVKHEGKLYQCVTAVTTAGAWAAANWSEVSLQDEIDTVNAHNDRQNGTKLTTASKNNASSFEINNDTTPTSAKPNAAIDFRANDMRIYRDEGSGWVTKGDIPYNISNQIGMKNVLIKQASITNTGDITGIDCSNYRYVLLSFAGNPSNYRSFLFPVTTNEVCQDVNIDATATIFVHLVFRLNFSSKKMIIDSLSTGTWSGCELNVYGVE